MTGHLYTTERGTPEEFQALAADLMALQEPVDLGHSTLAQTLIVFLVQTTLVCANPRFGIPKSKVHERCELLSDNHFIILEALLEHFNPTRTLPPPLEAWWERLMGRFVRRILGEAVDRKKDWAWDGAIRLIPITQSEVPTAHDRLERMAVAASRIEDFLIRNGLTPERARELVHP